MIISIAELILACMIAAWIFKKIHVPSLVGMLLTGVLLGPYVLDIISPEVLNVSHEFRLTALIVILLRAGLEIKKDTLSRVGKTVLLLSFVPAIFEIAIVTLLSPVFLGLTYFEGAILGTILGAVSPAVVVPFMIKFIEERRGEKKGIPTFILAATSIDDVFVIVVYSILVGVYTGSQLNILWKIAGIPISIILGVLAGFLIGIILIRLFDRFDMVTTKRVMIIMAVSILLFYIEKLIEHWIPFASLIAVMSIGFIILEKREKYSSGISLNLSKIWIIAEIILFSLVGSEVNIEVALQSGLNGAILIFIGLIARSIGSYLCTFGTDLNTREKMFVVFAYLPKATVQAAIGAAPLVAMKAKGMNTYPGEMILAVAVLSIILTAPLGALIINITGNKWLKREHDK